MKKGLSVITIFLIILFALGMSGCVHVVPDYECLHVENSTLNPNLTVTPKSNACPTYKTSMKQANLDFHHHAYKKALREYTLLALDGNAEAQYRLGYMYFYGQGTKKDKFLSRGWFQKSAIQGHRKAAQALQMIDRP